MPQHRQPIPARRRARPAVVAATGLALVCTVASAALAATAPADDTPVAPTPTTASTASATSTPGTATTPSTTATPSSTATASPPTSSPPASTSESPAPDDDAGGGAWLSGASGEGAVDGSLGDWRGAPVQIVGTWADQGDNQTELYSIAPGGEVADFDGAIDIAPGGLLPGDTWAQAAAGAYDDRWEQSLTKMADLRDGDGTTYIRPFHEFNLAGWDWSVTPADADDFVAAWKRYRTVQQAAFPEAKLVYGVNVTSSGTDLDWRTTWPGAGQADVLGVDTYNGWPTITTAAEFDAQLDATGDDGIPVGLGAYLDQAAEWGVPLAVPEWSGRAEMGDEPAYVEGMHAFFAEHAGQVPGQLAYEILFNAPQDDGNFQLYGDGVRMPESSATYAQLYSDAPPVTTAGAAEGAGVDSTEQAPTSTPTSSPSSTASVPSATAVDEESAAGAEGEPAEASSAASDPEESEVLAAIEDHLSQIDDLLADLAQVRTTSTEGGGSTDS